MTKDNVQYLLKKSQMKNFSAFLYVFVLILKFLNKLI